MTKKPRQSSKSLSHELFPELRQPKPKSRGIRPSDEEIATALKATRGRYAIAAQRLSCSERSLRRWVAENPELESIVHEERELLLDQTEVALDRILANPKHHRHFDAIRLTLQSLRRADWGVHVHHTNKTETQVNVHVAMEDRPDFWPEVLDVDEQGRLLELMRKDSHLLSHAELEELRALRRKARSPELIEAKPSGA